MASEKERQRISDSKSGWQQFTDAFTPGMQGEQAQAVNKPVAATTESPEAEAIRLRRLEQRRAANR